MWSPFQQVRIDRIEAVQKKATRVMYYRLPWSNSQPCPSYQTRCLLFGLESLENRRYIAQCIFIQKLLNGNIDCPVLLSLLDMSAPTRELRPRALFRLGFRGTVFGAHDPLMQLTRAYNGLGDLVDFNSSVSDVRTVSRNFST